MFHTPFSCFNLYDLFFIRILLFLWLINKLPMFIKTSLIDIDIAINVAQGGSRLKLTKRTKIDCSQLTFAKVIKIRNIKAEN